MLSGTGSTRTSEEVYEAYQPSLDQFGKDSLTYIPSSPWSRVGKFYELYKSGCVTLDEYNKKHKEAPLPVKDEEEAKLDREEGLDLAVEADPEMLVVQLPSWALYKDWEYSEKLGGPKLKRAIQYPPLGEKPENLRMARLESRNPEKFKVERRAQFAEVMNAYLDPKKVDAMFEPFWGGRTLEAQREGRMDREYRIHIDPAKSNADFALAIAHLEEAPEPDEHGEYWPHVIIDYLHVWRAKDFPEHTIDYVQVYKELEETLERFPTTSKFTADQWNSVAFLAMLRKKFGQNMRITESTFSDRSNRERAEYFKSAINLGWVHSYRDDLYEGSEGSLLELELKFLEERNGKVVKQEFGPVTKKDLADCAMECTIDLLKDSLDRWETSLLGITPSYGSTRVDKLRANPGSDLLSRYSRPLSSLKTNDSRISLHQPNRRGQGGGYNRLRGR